MEWNILEGNLWIFVTSTLKFPIEGYEIWSLDECIPRQMFKLLWGQIGCKICQHVNVMQKRNFFLESHLKSGLCTSKIKASLGDRLRNLLQKDCSLPNISIYIRVIF